MTCTTKRWIYLRALEPRGWRLGLERMQEFVRRANLADAFGTVLTTSPQFIPRVAGTKTAKARSRHSFKACCWLHGYRTGAFFSPLYVVDPRERVWFGQYAK